MKRSFLLIFVLASAVFTGCTELRLADGDYEAALSGRRDYAGVYGDTIFLRVRDPLDESSTPRYIYWAGKYSIGENNKIIFENMEKQMARDWKFHYEFFMNGNVIQISDLGRESIVELRFTDPRGIRQKPKPMTSTADNDGEPVDPFET